jgi:dimethylargininase
MPTSPRVFDFDFAIVRTPAASVIDGLRAGDHAGPSYTGVLAEHAAYVAALRSSGVEVAVLPGLEDFPDSVFVEDPALVFAEAAIVLRPGAPSRAGEADSIRAALNSRFDRVLELAGDGHADGGDVLVTPEEVIIGLSSRTDRAGAEALAACLSDLGMRPRIVQPPAGVLHLKTGCSLLDETTVIATPVMARSGILDGFRHVVTPRGEEAAANALRVNEVVLLGEAFPQTRALVEAHGLNVLPLAVAEIGKIDAGLSCMSLRWRRGDHR